MQKGFIDMSSLHSALCAMRQGKDLSLSQWHNQSLLEVTYFLLHPNIRVVPRLGRAGGEAGDTNTFFKVLPNISSRSTHKRSAMQATLLWLEENQAKVNEAWLSTKGDELLWQWAIPQRDLKWMEQSETYGSLFDEEFIPHIAKALLVDEADLRKIYIASGEAKRVKGWLKNGTSSEDAKIAESAWMIGGLVRGKYYENLACASKLQLIPHLYRMRLSEKLQPHLPKEVYRTEELFIKVLIASSLREITSNRRIIAWGENIDRARRAIEAGGIELHKIQRGADAEEEAAFLAAKKVGIVGTTKIYGSILNQAISWTLPALVAYELHPWALLEATGVRIVTGVGQLVYKENRGVSLGEDIVNRAFTTKLAFRWLAKSVPGRIDRKYLINSPSTPLTSGSSEHPPSPR